MHPYTTYAQLYSWYYAYTTAHDRVVDCLFELLYSGDTVPVSGVGYIGGGDPILGQFDMLSGQGGYVDELHEIITDDINHIAIEFARRRVMTITRAVTIGHKTWYQIPGSIGDDPVEFELNLSSYMHVQGQVYECLFARIDQRVTDANFTYDGFMRDFLYTDHVCQAADRLQVMTSRIRYFEIRNAEFTGSYKLADRYTPKIIVKTIADYIQSMLDYMDLVGIGFPFAREIFRADLHKMIQLLE